jgi:hypothetical protein
MLTALNEKEKPAARIQSIEPKYKPLNLIGNELTYCPEMPKSRESLAGSPNFKPSL